MQDEHPNIGAGVAGGEGLPVGPHAEHGIMRAGVELGYDGDLHTRPR